MSSYIDSRLSVTSFEVLPNGMNATASFFITADTENSGTAILSGDFGTLTFGSIDADGAIQAGDVGGAVSNTTESTDSTSSSVYGIHYAGTLAGLSVAAQVNANTGPTGSGAAKTKSTQMSATYAMNGLTLGYSYASALADDDSNSNHDGIHEGQTAVGASYAMGDLVVSVGKVNLKDTAVSPDALVSATYTMTADALTVVAQADNTPSGDYQIDTTYAFSDAISLSSEIDSTAGKQTTLVATYTMDETVVSIAKTDDGTTDASIALNYGKAVITAARNGGDKESSLSYSVSF